MNPLRASRHSGRRVGVAAAAALLAVAACKPGAPTGLGVIPFAVEVTPNTLSFDAFGATTQLTAVALDENGDPISGAAFEWTSSNALVAVVSSDGTVTSVGPGTATITATAAGIASNPVTVAVRQVVASIDVTPPGLTFESLGDSQTLTAVARDASGTEIPGVTFTWTSEDTGVATVDAAGLVTATGRGTTTVSASVGGVISNAVSVAVGQAVASIDVTPTGVSFQSVGEQITLTAVATDAGGSPVPGITFTWTSSDPSVATVSNAGVVTATGPGTATVTAAVGAVTSNPVSVAVQQSVATIDVTPVSVSLTFLGEQATLTAVARDAGGNPIAGVNFTWTSDDTGVATVSSSGVVTAVGNGSAAVTAAVGTVTSNASTVTVQQTISTIEVTPTSLTLTFIGEDASLSATARDAGGSPVPGANLGWASSNNSVARVSSTGVVTAVANGAASITASAGGVTSNPVAVTVQQAVTSITVTPTSLTFTFLGEQATLSATARDAGGTPVSGVSFTWATSNASVASVSGSGVVTANANGSATVTAAARGVTSGGVNVTVQQRVATISVTPTSVSLTALGQQATLAATARDAGGSIIAGVTLNWTSSNTLAVTVSQTGVVTAVGAGISIVTAAADGVTSNGVSVTVTLPAAIAFDQSSSQSGSGVGSLSWNHNVGNGINRIIIVSIGVEDASLSNANVVGVTYGGAPLTRAAEDNVSSSGVAQNVETWYLLDAGLPNGNATIQVTLGGVSSGVNAGAISLENVAQSGPEAASTNTVVGSSTISTGISTQTDGAWVIDAVGAGDSGSFSDGSGQTQRWEESGSTSAAAASTKSVANAGGTNMSQTLNNANRLVHVLIAVAPAAAP